MCILQYYDSTAAISDLKRKFPVPPDHYKKGNREQDSIVQRSKEVFVLVKLLEANDPLITYPLEVEHVGDREGFPDFLLRLNGVQYFAEISEITDETSQLFFQGRKAQDNLGIIGQNDITPIVKTRVENKNRKIEQYITKTGISNSILLIEHNIWPPFSYGSPGDELRLNEIQSSYSHTFIFIPVYEKEASYIKI